MIQAHRLAIKWARTLHVYLTMFGFMLLLFFSITGFMLNHEDWFLPAQTTTGKLPIELLGTPENRDAIVEALQNDFGMQGTMESFDHVDEKKAFQVLFKFKDPATEIIVTSTAVIQRADGVTVVTIEPNKPSRERVTIVDGKMPMELLVPDDKSKELPIVERLRKDFGARGEVQDPPKYEKESESFGVVFKAPSYQATATIRASDGYTKVTHQSRGIAGVMLDLHRGKESGPAWSFVIDGVSILFVIVSITGLMLWTSLRSRAQYGIAVLLLGAAVGLVVYFMWVPR